jgi:tetratricopeptide (TPR) repeat protein
LYPLLDLATTLDPFFNIAYRFGAIFLTEAYPNGPGRPDQALALLQKGLAARPSKWQYAMDIGFVYYWWLHDYEAAAKWFDRASTIEGSPWWLKTLAATTLAQGGEREASRMLWQQLGESATDNEWLQNEARRRLLQLTALDDLDQLLTIIEKYIRDSGLVPAGWDDLVRAGYLREAPRDPSGVLYVLDRRAGQISLSSTSPLFPLPAEPPALRGISRGRQNVR